MATNAISVFVVQRGDGGKNKNDDKNGKLR